MRNRYGRKISSTLQFDVREPGLRPCMMRHMLPQRHMASCYCGLLEHRWRVRENPNAEPIDPRRLVRCTDVD